MLSQQSKQHAGCSKTIVDVGCEENESIASAGTHIVGLMMDRLKKKIVLLLARLQNCRCFWFNNPIEK